MKYLKIYVLTALTLGFGLLMSCGDDEKKSGQLTFKTVTTGPIDGNHMYLMTFSGLTGDADIPNGVQIGANDEQVVNFLRWQEKLTVYLSNIPENCLDNISSASATGDQFASGGTPSDPKHPEAQYQSIVIIPESGELTFTIECN
jgi:hypothetical protein